jgi:hypothetical protein
VPIDRYQDIDETGLNKLHDGLDILESLVRDAVQELDLFLYGLTQSETIVDAAREAIADAADLDESDVQLSEVAVAIPLSSDAIRALIGSGFKARREDFAYTGTGGEGIRTQSFAFSHFKPVLALSEFSQMAIAQSDAWVDDFLKQFGNKQPAEIKQNVKRTEEATQPGVPAAPETQAPPAAPDPDLEIPKVTSLAGGLKLADILEDFLR